MAITKDDLLVVQQGGSVFKTEYGTIKTDIIGDVPRQIVTHVSDTKPTVAQDGDLWFNPNDALLYVYAEKDVVLSSSPIDAIVNNGLNINFIDGTNLDRIPISTAGVISNQDGLVYSGSVSNSFPDTFQIRVSTDIGAQGFLSGDVLSWVDNSAPPAFDWVPVSADVKGGAEVSNLAPSNPEVGDLWFDANTGILFIYYADADSNQWVSVGGTTSVGKGFVTISDTAPSTPAVGDLWYYESVGKLYMYQIDSNSDYWVSV